MFWVAGAGLLSSLVFSLVIFLEMWEQPLRIIDSQLKSVAGAVAVELATGQKALDGEQVKVLPVSSERYWIKGYDQDQHIVYQSAMSRVVDIPLNRDRGDKAYMIRTHISRNRMDLHQDDEDEVMFRVRVIAETIAGAPYLIQIAKPVENLEEESSDLLVAIAIGLAVSTALLLGLSYAMAGRIVKPIVSINRLARDINENSLEKRIQPGSSRDEIYELATCLNQMFDRLQFSFSRQKQFLADASHELKSPIAMLRFFFDEAMQRRDLPESFLRQLDVQCRNVLRMDRLVKTLLELSILEIKALMTPEPFSLTDLVHSVLGDFAPLMERADIRLETEMHRQIEIWGDKDKIRRALINIFDNAVKYNAENGRIQVNVSRQKDRIQLSVYNTGSGIPMEDLPKVFDAFYRVEKSRSLQFGGSGLGLAIVKRIVQLHGGSVKLESEEGVWARITMVLPVKPLPAHCT